MSSRPDDVVDTFPVEAAPSNLASILQTASMLRLPRDEGTHASPAVESCRSQDCGWSVVMDLRRVEPWRSRNAWARRPIELDGMVNNRVDAHGVLLPARSV